MSGQGRTAVVNQSSRRKRLSSAVLRGALAERLQNRRDEIEQQMLARVYSVSDPTEVGDPTYVEGLRAAVSAALGYSLAGIEAGRSDPGPIPVELLAQARHAASDGVSLDTVLRRYFAGHALLGDFIMRESENGTPLPFVELQRVLRVQAALFDRLIVAVTAEHGQELQSRALSSEHRRAECVEKLLAGDLADTSSLAYEFDAWHLGVILSGPGAELAARELAARIDRRPLLLEKGEGSIWGWFGGRHKVTGESLLRDLPSWPAELSLAIGEPGKGLSGWRLTHRQAAAALPIAMRSGPRGVARYADVSLLASALQDEVLVRSLEELFLAPLAGERDGGEILRQTLRAYFAAEGNVSSAAATLGVSRQTVTSRLKLAEMRIGRGINACGSELRAALSLETLTATNLDTLQQKNHSHRAH